MAFIEKNLNPKNRNASDCVVRAIMCAENKSWLEVYDELCAIGRKKNDIPSSKRVFNEYLKKYKTLNPMYIDKSEKKHRYKVSEIEGIHKNKIIIVQLAGHMACVKFGDLIDTWNCSNKAIYKMWHVC